MEALTPPAQLSEWHLLSIEALRTVQAIYDLFPKDDVIDNSVIDEFLLAIAPDLEEKYSALEEQLSEVAVRLPADLRQQMIEVDCLDPHIVPGDYDEPDDHGNNFESATRIVIGEAVVIELAYRVDKDVLVFLAEPGTEYELTLDWESYSRSRPTARPILALFDAAGQELARLSHDIFGSQDKMMWQAVTRGDYYIVIGDRVTHGSITFTVTDGEATEQLERGDHGNSVGDATAIRVGVDVEGVIDYEGDSDYFRFTAEEGQLYQIDVSLGTLPDSYLELLHSDDWSLAYNDDHGNSPASRIFWEAPASGDYYLVVGGYGAGSYTLTVSHSTIVDDHGNEIDDATVAAVGVDVEGVIDYEGDPDYFRFTAEEGQLYQIDLSLGSLPDSYLELLDSDDWSLAYNDDHGNSPASRIFWEAPASGDYYLLVGGYGAGSYTLTVSHSTIVDDHGNEIDDATVAAVGVDVEGVIDYEGDSDYFRFTAEEGQLYQIDLSLGSLPDSYLELLHSDDWSLAYNDDHGNSPASRIFWEAPESGDYYLVVGGYGAGSYTLTVSHSTIVDDYGNEIDDATVAAVGVDVEGVIDYEGDLDYFRFTAEEGQLYQIGVSLGTLPDSYLELLDSDDWSLAYNDDHGNSPASRIFWEAPASGDYYLLVGGYGAGSYTLTVSHSTIVDDHGNEIDDATVAAVGVDVEGVIDYEGDSDYFRFTAEEGQLYQIDLSLGSLPDSYLELLDSDDWSLAYNDNHGDSPASRIFWEAPASGDYYLVVEATGWDAQVGSYTLTVARR